MFDSFFPSITSLCCYGCCTHEKKRPHTVLGSVSTPKNYRLWFGQLTFCLWVHPLVCIAFPQTAEAVAGGEWGLPQVPVGGGHLWHLLRPPPAPCTGPPAVAHLHTHSCRWGGCSTSHIILNFSSQWCSVLINPHKYCLVLYSKS